MANQYPTGYVPPKTKGGRTIGGAPTPIPTPTPTPTEYPTGYVPWTPGEWTLGGGTTAPATTPAATPTTTTGGVGPWGPVHPTLFQSPFYQYLAGQQQLPTWRGPEWLRYPSAQAWWKMRPYERETYQGMAQSAGAYWPDVQQQMRSLWPRWNMPRHPRWGAAWW